MPRSGLAWCATYACTNHLEGRALGDPADGGYSRRSLPRLHLDVQRQFDDMDARQITQYVEHHGGVARSSATWTSNRATRNRMRIEGTRIKKGALPQIGDRVLLRRPASGGVFSSDGASDPNVTGTIIGISAEAGSYHVAYQQGGQTCRVWVSEV